MNRWPTVPVAPRTATLRLRIAVKFDLSKESRGEPPVPFVDPAEETKTGRSEVGQHLAVGQDAGALQIHQPAAAHAGVVLDLLIEQLAFAANVEGPDGDAVAVMLGRGRVLPRIGVIALDERDAVRPEVPLDRSQERKALFPIWIVDEVAHQQHATERSAEVEVLDACFDLLGAFDQLEHFRIEVDRDDAPPQCDQGMRYTARP